MIAGPCRRSLQRDVPVKDIPSRSEPLAGDAHCQRLASILVRFLALLAVAIAILAVAWNR
jgi:hypothetical protein